MKDVNTLYVFEIDVGALYLDGFVASISKLCYGLPLGR